MDVTDFDYHGARWRRIKYAPELKLACALDLGQQSDPSAIAIVEYHRTPLDEYAQDDDRRVITQLTREFFDVRFLERLPLHTNYVDVAAYVAEVMARSPLREFSAPLIVDVTGGRAAADILRRCGLRFESVTITAGLDATYHGRGEWHVPKGALIAAVDARLSVKELRFSDKLKEAETIKRELQNFRRTISATGHLTFNARSGAHDDLILATALAVWWLGHRRSRGEFSQGSYRF